MKTKSEKEEAHSFGTRRYCKSGNPLAEHGVVKWRGGGGGWALCGDKVIYDIPIITRDIICSDTL